MIEVTSYFIPVSVRLSENLFCPVLDISKIIVSDSSDQLAIYILICLSDLSLCLGVMEFLKIKSL